MSKQRRDSITREREREGERKRCLSGPPISFSLQACVYTYTCIRIARGEPPGGFYRTMRQFRIYLLARPREGGEKSVLDPPRGALLIPSALVSPRPFFDVLCRYCERERERKTAVGRDARRRVICTAQSSRRCASRFRERKRRRWWWCLVRGSVARAARGQGRIIFREKFLDFRPNRESLFTRILLHPPA